MAEGGDGLTFLSMDRHCLDCPYFTRGLGFQLVSKLKLVRPIAFILWASIFFSLNKICKVITPNFLIFFICLWLGFALGGQNPISRSTND